MKSIKNLLAGAALTLAMFAVTQSDVRAADNSEVPLHPVRTTMVVSNGANVKIDADAGDVRVVTWMFDKVAIESRGGEYTLERTTTQDGNTILFHAKQIDPSKPLDGKGITHTLYVPASTHLEIFSGNGNVFVNGVYGDVKVAADQGETTLEHVSAITEVISNTGMVLSDAGSALAVPAHQQVAFDLPGTSFAE